MAIWLAHRLDEGVETSVGPHRLQAIVGPGDFGSSSQVTSISPCRGPCRPIAMVGIPPRCSTDSESHVDPTSSTGCYNVTEPIHWAGPDLATLVKRITMPRCDLCGPDSRD
jgi:hypothetical protein